MFNYKYLFIISIIAIAQCSKVGQQKSLAVTIYNDNFAMVKDIRQISFQKGKSDLYFTDVSSNIQSETVTFKALTNTQKVRVFEQNFEKNLVNKQSILQKYIQKEVLLYVTLGDTVRKVKGTLLGYKSGYIVKTDTGVDIFESVSAIQFPSLPNGFFTLPTLNWKVHSEEDFNSDCQLAYRTTGFKWKADYSMVLNENQTKADVGGWVTIDNYSGKKYTNAKLKLIAGDVNTVNQRPIRQQKPMYDKAMPSPAPSFTEKSFSDFHLYTLSQLVTLNQQSQKQVQFIPKKYGIEIRKYNQIEINVGGYNEQKLTARNKVEFINSEKEGLGIPFPKGTFRVFKEDTSDKSLEFIGEDHINHTPKNEKITLKTGNAFDIVANKLSIDRQSYTSGYSAHLNLTITNHKNVDTEIQVKLNNGYQDNLKITWQNTEVKLDKQSSSSYVFTRVFKPEETFVYKWSEQVRN